MKTIWSTVAALMAGFAGGISGMLVMRAHEPPRSEQMIRARGFELVNEAGEPISFWGVDQGQNAVLAFGSRGLDLRGAPHGVPAGLSNPENQLAAFGLQGDDAPVLAMRGADGKTRVSLLLSPDAKPILMMEDETGPRVALGIEQSDTPGPQDNDWTLVFGPERARIGMFTRTEGGQTYVRGGLMVNKDKVKYP
jgi:hypothetical protein